MKPQQKEKSVRKLVLYTFTLLTVAVLAQPGFATDKANTTSSTITIAQLSKPVFKTDPIDINTATEEQLKALSGINSAYAKKIIAGRPYTNKDQIVSKKIIPGATYDKIKDKIITKKK
jgi:DNA uptake protein ComE-like DNA-binding protein